MAEKLELLKELLNIDIDAVKAMAAADDEDGKGARKMARATYDFAVDGGAIGDIETGVYLPDNAIITRAWTDVVTTCTSATDAATIGIEIGSTDLQAAVAISAGGNRWDAGLADCATKGDDPGDPSTFVKLTAQSQIIFDIAVEAVTAGKFVLFVEYVVGA